MNSLDRYYDILLDYGVATEDELQLVTKINGYNEKTLDDILYVRTGNRSLDQFCDENEIELDESVKHVTNRIISGASISEAISSQLEASTILRDKGITSVDDVDELVLFITNDGDLYRSRTLGIIKNLKNKKAKGKYDPELAVKAYMYLADDGVRKYDRLYGSGQGKLFVNKSTREEIAAQLRDYYDEEVNS